MENTEKDKVKNNSGLRMITNKPSSFGANSSKKLRKTVRNTKTYIYRYRRMYVYMYIPTSICAMKANEREIVLKTSKGKWLKAI